MDASILFPHELIVLFPHISSQIKFTFSCSALQATPVDDLPESHGCLLFLSQCINESQNSNIIEPN
jgi:hypothetical protein